LLNFFFQKKKNEQSRMAAGAHTSTPGLDSIFGVLAVVLALESIFWRGTEHLTAEVLPTAGQKNSSPKFLVVLSASRTTQGTTTTDPLGRCW